MRVNRLMTLILATVLLSGAAWSATDTVLIVHTNDLHDHIRPGYDRVGGLPYVSGYIKSILDSRMDTLVLDGGDVMEKGDMVAFLTRGAIMYEAMGRVGYDAGAIGNHDVVYGLDHLRQCEAAAGFPLLCLNLLDSSSLPCFTPSRIFDVDGVKVAVIGLAVPKSANYLDLQRSAAAVAKEAERLGPQAHLLVVVCHLGSAVCATISARAPAIDVFVSGHTHEAIRNPRVVEETGALIVQAGQYARYVGRLELVIDLDTEAIVHNDYQLIEMRHDAVPCDTAMLEWIRQREREVCPEAPKLVGRATRPLALSDAACLAAAALRQHGHADIAFCHPGKIMRNGIPEGDVDVNALFVSGGQRGHTIVSVFLTGADVEAYMEYLIRAKKGQTQWAGFKAQVENAPSRDARTVKTSLDHATTYRAVLPQLEWTAHLKPLMEKRVASGRAGEQPSQPLTNATQCPFSFIEAFAAYVEALTAKGLTLDAQLPNLAAALTF